MTSRTPQSPKSARGVASQLLGSVLGPLIGLAAVILLFAIADFAQDGVNTFLTLRNFRTMAVQTSPIAVAALGMTLIIIAGGVDLSAGTAMALAATVLAYVLRESDVQSIGRAEGSLMIAAAVLAGIGTGCACGLLNGLLISFLRVAPFIVTLGTMTFYLGIAKIVANETTVRPLPQQVPEWLPAMVSPSRPDPEWLIPRVLPNLPLGVWLLIGLSGLLAIVLRYTVFGRHVFALGSSEATARLCGINVTATKIAVYTLAGLFVGLAGVYQFGRLSQGSPTSGTGLELEIIAAVVIGGGSLSGGRGTVLGTLAGAAIMGVIGSGVTLLGLENPVQNIINGVIIVAAVTLDQFRQRRLDARA